MSKIAQGFFRAALVGIAISVLRVAAANYIVNTGFGPEQVRDDGTHVAYYNPPPDVYAMVEARGTDVAVTPDLQTVYEFTNSRGSSLKIFAYDQVGLSYLPDKSLHSGLYQPGLGIDDFILNARMSMVRPVDPSGKGDLYSISGSLQFQPGITPQIKRYNRATDSYVETIDPPNPQPIYDFGFGPDHRLYMAARDGIFVYEELATGFHLVSPTPLLGSLTGKLTFGPDGRMYLVNAAAGAIQRYTTDGSFVDNFSSLSIAGPDSLTSLQFGVDGNLHVLVHNRRIDRFNGMTGTLLGSTISLGTPDYFFNAIGRITYLPIPEPDSLLLAAFGMALAVERHRRNPARH